jgi:hypothetical protein
MVQALADMVPSENEPGSTTPLYPSVNLTNEEQASDDDMRVLPCEKVPTSVRKSKVEPSFYERHAMAKELKENWK